jgi:hypothetical protein
VTYPLLFYLFRWVKPPHDKHSISPPESPSLDPATPRPTSKRQYIPHRIAPPDVNPRDALVDPSGAIFHVSLLLVTLAVLVGTGFAQPHPQVWMITAPAGIIGLIRELVVDWRRGPKRAADKREDHAPTQSGALAADGLELEGKVAPTYPPGSRTLEASSHITLTSLWRRFAGRFPSSAHIIAHLPLPLLPFAFGCVRS